MERLIVSNTPHVGSLSREYDSTELAEVREREKCDSLATLKRYTLVPTVHHRC
jgi:hypothetical protein